MELGDKIKMLRIKQGLTLEEVGERVGVGKSTVRKWESGQIANMRRDKIALVAKALNVSPAYLMGWSDFESEAQYPVSKRIRERIGTELANVDTADVDASREKMNIEMLNKLADGAGAVCVDDALEVSDMLGLSINDLLGIEEPATMDGLSKQEQRFIQVFSQLTSANQDLLIETALRFLQAQGDSSDSRD